MKRTLRKFVVAGTTIGALSLGGVALAGPAQADGGWHFAGTYTGANGSYAVFTRGPETVRIWYAPR